MKSPILNFFLLILKISLDFNLDTGYKGGRFFETLAKKNLKFVLNKRNGTVVFNLGFVLLLVKIDLILEKQDCKKDVLEIYKIGCVEMIFGLLTKVVIVHIGATIV